MKLKRKIMKIFKKLYPNRKKEILKENRSNIIEKEADFAQIVDNKVEGRLPILRNSKIIFNGKNNILYCEENVTLENTIIHFQGNNSLVFLSSNKNHYKLNVSINHNNVFYIGKDNYINGRINAALSEEKNIIIGSEGLFSFDIWLRLADPHIIYNCKTKQRVNLSKSIYIGDHVWVGQHATILKGTQIGSGSIIAAMGVVAGKKIPSNQSWGGNPVRQIAKDIFFTNNCVHKYTSKETKESLVCNTDKYIYCENEMENISFEQIEQDLQGMQTAEERMIWIQEHISKNTKKNRFYQAEDAR